jgi:hypothetical protein
VRLSIPLSLAAAAVGLTLACASAAGVAAPSEGASLDSIRPLDSTTTPKKRTYVVAAMGDSLTDPKSQGGKYLDYLKDKCPKSRFDSYGKGGNMTNQMRKRFAKDVLGEGGDGSKPQYTHVVILGGIGDILSNETAGRTAEKIEKDLGLMYQMAHDKGVAVIALTLPPWGAFQAYDSARHQMTLDVNAWIRAVPPNVDQAVDIYPLLSCGVDRNLCDDYAWPDKLHWVKKGHEVVGAELYKDVFSDCE